MVRTISTSTSDAPVWIRRVRDGAGADAVQVCNERSVFISYIARAVGFTAIETKSGRDHRAVIPGFSSLCVPQNPSFHRYDALPRANVPPKQNRREAVCFAAVSCGLER